MTQKDVDELCGRGPIAAFAKRDEQKEAEPQADNCILRGSVEITVFRDSKVLAVNSRNFDGFCGIGGKVEPGESFEQAARRELWEETGCQVLSITFIAGHTLDTIEGDDAKKRWYCAGFVADIGKQEPHSNEVGTTPFWTTKEELIKNGLFPEWYSWWFGLLKRSFVMGDIIRFRDENVRLREVLENIANGSAGLDITHLTKPEFYQAMWDWSQKIARAALAQKTEAEEWGGDCHDQKMKGVEEA